MYSVVMMLALSGASEVTEFGHRRSCSGCSGCYGCSGSYCSGCYGCYGGYSSYGCHGCHGGWRHGCHGGYSHGCCGGYSVHSYGCCGGYSSYGCHGVIVTPVTPATPSTTIPSPTPKEVRAVPQTSPAIISVQLPADATLYFDGMKMKATSTNRVFTTPALDPAKTFFYNIKAEVEQDGQLVSTTHRVQFRAGQRVQVSFGMNQPGTLTARQE
jgi:uncharacterized protein (TIGR03000 family)